MSDIVIYGRGKTGQSLYKMLIKQGKTPVFYDDINGFDDGYSFTDKSVVLLSPGVKPNSLGIINAQRAGAKIITELEFCFDYCLGKIVSVTGTNGKTTTCEMINHILKKNNIACRLLGNGGVPLSSEVLNVTANEIVVLESSSFQLSNAQKFAPYISVFTNLGCDHLDYHGNIEDYITAKVNNFIRQRDGYAIFNVDDNNVVELSNLCKCKRLYYSTCSDKADCYFDGDNVVFKIDDELSTANSAVLKNYTRHNLSNALAAIAVTCLLGISLDVAVKSLIDYQLLPHRMEVVKTINGVTFVNDSKATNVHATVSALSNYTQPLALILGGSDKGEAFDDIFTNLDDNVIAVCASGDTAKKIADCGKSYGTEVVIHNDIRESVEYCFNVLKVNGGVVLMSNACASFDKFNGYAERGEYFRQVVKELGNGKTTD